MIQVSVAMAVPVAEALDLVPVPMVAPMAAMAKTVQNPQLVAERKPAAPVKAPLQNPLVLGPFIVMEAEVLLEAEAAAVAAEAEATKVVMARAAPIR